MAIQRLRSTWQQVDPVAEAETLRCERQRELRKLKRIRLGDGLADTIAAGIVRELARDIDALNQRIAGLDAQIAALLEEQGNPVADLLGAGNQIAAALIAHAGDVRRSRDAAAFARFCGAAPIPCGSGQTSGHHRLHRGGNRQLNAALYRIAIVQQRRHPLAKAFLARRIAEGKTPREARRAFKRHLANVAYRRLHVWAETCPAMNDLTSETRALHQDPHRALGPRPPLRQQRRTHRGARPLALAPQLHPTPRQPQPQATRQRLTKAPGNYT
jgi:transposase